MLLTTKKLATQGPITRAKSNRIAGLDLVRFFAALCVIGTHSGEWPHHISGYFRMPFYAAMVTFLVTGGVLRGKHGQFLEFARTRGLRLLVPFVVWMVPFGIPAFFEIVNHRLGISDL